VSTRLLGDELPHLITDVPGPGSRALTDRLVRVESPNITAIEPAPIFWTEARGAAVRDADGNVYVDLTAGFGVAHAGHAEARVTAAIAGQAARLAHGLGDVFPPEPKVRLLERLAAIAPGDLTMSILANSGSEAVEAAFKTAVVRTGRTGIVAFEGAYHGLTYGALATTWRSDFRAPFAPQLFAGVHFAPYPIAGMTAALASVDRILHTAEASAHPIGAIIIEPVLGRGGLRVPPDGFLAALRERCDGERIVLIFDEIYTGCGRTGRWFACEHEGVSPDLLVAGKALSGSLPISAVIGKPAVMQAWPVSTGEAIHTSTFLGNPIACAAALAQLDAIQSGDLLRRAERLGEVIRETTTRWAARFEAVGEPRGRGLLQGAPMRGPGQAVRVAERCLRRGVLLLAEGTDAEVLALTPPAVITEPQLDFALAVVEEAIRAELE
jgi:4-aminobutyrate aminotransferase / (S)-3-amino-2-methylpropionate transaminase / 5-aminovalerate transaminase